MSAPNKPSGSPLSYVVKGWPHGRVRKLSAEEGGARVAYQVEQLRLFVIELLERRQQRGITQAKLAEKTGLRPNTVSELESGSSWPDWSTLALLAWALEADLRFVPRSAIRVEDPQPRPPGKSARTDGPGAPS